MSPTSRPLRLLHTADWQIGRQYAAFAPESAVPLMEERFAAVGRIAALAAAQQVDAVLVAGDVFDAQTVSERTLRRLFDLLAGFDGPWLLLPGNHDAALAESVWSRAQRLGLLGPNVHALLRPEPLLLPRLAVLPAPLTQRHVHADLTAWFDRAETPPGLARIGLAHGCVQGVLDAAIDAPNPIAADRAASARLDYLALGDWHGCRRIDARTWYSGTPEPDRHKDNGAGRALLVELVPGAEPLVTPVETAGHRWSTLDVALQVASDLDGLAQRLDELAPHDVVQLRLSGSIDLAAQQRLQLLLARADARVRRLDVDRQALQLQPTDADLAALHADGYVGALLQELRETQHGTHPEAQRARDALLILASVLAQRDQPA